MGRDEHPLARAEVRHDLLVPVRQEAGHGAGRIQVTEATRRALGPAWPCEPRGVVEIKGKGPMAVYLLRSRPEEGSGSAG